MADSDCTHLTGTQSLEKVCELCVEEDLINCNEGENVAGKGNSTGDC